MKIYTARGDEGETSLIGGKRVPKYSPEVEAYGTLDELNAQLGFAASECSDEFIRNEILHVQNLLFEACADFATPEESLIHPRISNADVSALEEKLDQMEAELPKTKGFTLPGGTRTAASLQCARTICRRAERRAWAAYESSKPHATVLIWVNRLSDYLFLLAKTANWRQGVDEIPWEKIPRNL